MILFIVFSLLPIGKKNKLKQLPKKRYQSKEKRNVLIFFYGKNDSNFHFFISKTCKICPTVILRNLTNFFLLLGLSSNLFLFFFIKKIPLLY